MCTILIVGRFDCFDPKNEKPMALTERYFATNTGFVQLKSEYPAYVEFAPDHGYCTFSAGLHLPHWVPATARYIMAKLVLRTKLIFKVEQSSFDRAMTAEGDHIITGDHMWGGFNAYKETARKMLEMQFYKIVTPYSETLARGQESLKQVLKSSNLAKEGPIPSIFLQRPIRVNQDGKEIIKLIWRKLPQTEILNLVSFQ